MIWVVGSILATLILVNVLLLYCILRSKKFYGYERDGKVFVLIVFREGKAIRSVYGWIMKNAFNSLGKESSSFLAITLTNKDEMVIRASEVAMARKIDSFWSILFRSRE